ncbi:HTH domain-containing protein [bacterium]|uniref:ECF-type sigma factor n=1 Tax=Rubinisphaera sp. JC750 TaxID=2898658 RepID=UPI000C3DC779|nr:ECF-type sigma factor [Rubinisphaera sp. JC750]MBB01840.1 RNA polymerase subunit sigma-70 [Planctomyces sp.]MBR9800929.1 HTH domain-containing protein [bacterium]
MAAETPPSPSPDDDASLAGPGSVSMMLDALKQGENDAVAELWDRYFRRLVPLAKRRLGGASRKVADEEDIALSVINNLVNGAARGAFPQLADREELWKLLIVLTQRKVTDQVRRDLAQKRGGNNVRGESIFMKAGDGEQGLGWDRVLNEEPTPQALALMEERCEQLMDTLEDDTLRQIARLKLESYTNEEIAEQLGVTTRTVKRKCALIREKWLQFAEAQFTVDLPE